MTRSGSDNGTHLTERVAEADTKTKRKKEKERERERVIDGGSPFLSSALAVAHFVQPVGP